MEQQYDGERHAEKNQQRVTGPHTGIVPHRRRPNNPSFGDPPACRQTFHLRRDGRLLVVGLTSSIRVIHRFIVLAQTRRFLVVPMLFPFLATFVVSFFLELWRRDRLVVNLAIAVAMVFGQ